MRTTFLLPMTLTLAVLAGGVAGCGDDPTTPDAFLDPAEAEAVLRSADALPMLPDLLDRAATRNTASPWNLVRAHELWAAGVADQAERGRARRALAVRHAAPVLAESLTAEDWAVVRQGLEDWIATAESALRHLSLPDVDARLRAARTHLARAQPERGDGAYFLLLASAELVETTPRYVARTLAARSDAAVRAAESARGAGPAPVRLRRAGRLNDWAQRAVREEEYLLAIQRAYYALQLVEDR